MKYASDFRRIARDALRGRWGVAVIAGLLASLLGAISSNGPEINFHYSNNGANVGLELGGQQIFTSGEGILPELQPVLAGGFVVVLLAVLTTAAVFFILGSIIEVGYCRFNLDMNDRLVEPRIGTMFDFFPHWKSAAMTRLLKFLYVLLWSLLLIIPGIIASYSYAMTGYILAENPDLDAGEALERSKAMMAGNRWRLFCLQFSFIGWGILSALTLGIGGLWLTPYTQSAIAAFYREVSGTERHQIPQADAYLNG